MSGHTKGPWAVWPMGDLWAVTCTGVDKTHPNEGMHVAHVSMPNEQHQQWIPQRLADARLIAAAPELLEALEAVFAVIEDSHIAGTEYSPLEKARAAIAKAKGEA